MSGRRGTAFVIDVASNEELRDVLRQLPVWGLAEVEKTPLDTFARTGLRPTANASSR